MLELLTLGSAKDEIAENHPRIDGDVEEKSSQSADMIRIWVEHWE